MVTDEQCCLCGQIGHSSDSCPMSEPAVSNIDRVLDAIRSGADYIRSVAETTGLPVRTVRGAFDQLRAVRYIEPYACAPRVCGVGSPQRRYRTTETLVRVEQAHALAVRAREALVEARGAIARARADMQRAKAELRAACAAKRQAIRATPAQRIVQRRKQKSVPSAVVVDARTRELHQQVGMFAGLMR